MGDRRSITSNDDASNDISSLLLPASLQTDPMESLPTSQEERTSSLPVLLGLEEGSRELEGQPQGGAVDQGGSSTSVLTYDPNDSTSPPDTKTWKVVGSKVYPLRSREGRVPVPGSEDDASGSGCEGGTGTQVVYFECQELEEVFEKLLKKAQGVGAKSLLELKRSPTQLVNVAS